MLRSINPFTGQLVAEYPRLTANGLEERLNAAALAFQSWRRSDARERRGLILAIEQGLLAQRSHLARTMALEMGKPIRQGLAEVDKCAWLCRHYAEHAEAYLQNEAIELSDSQCFVCYRPIGVVLGVMPWNFPFWQVFRFAIPAIAAGNVALLKHASNVSGCALAIERLFQEAGSPAGVFGVLLLPAREIGAVIEDPRICAVSLTGSTPAGRSVAATAGGVLKKVVLELGGSDPYIILPDAELEHAAKLCAASRLINSGQSCIAAKRFIVHQDVEAPFIEALRRQMQAAVLGDPLDEATDLGPMARLELRDELAAQVRRSIEQGARVELGGQTTSGPAAIYPATILSDVRPGMVAFDEELFGPVAAVTCARDEREAIALANQSCFGLGAAIFSADRNRACAIAADELEAGCCFVNDFVRSDPRIPFGGIKQSGFGRELARNGILEFCNVKSVVVASS
ncbi:MAG: NAD-dependent succinate-semialdehyde dehydrogenase [Myxococcota bacterium]|jgi:succinate-semialdehyde dehydrogenase/glutarate-semialdehyde dehydrogenase|nr:NAD-dependent succinate-semialdehyde dehydrogenase [Myxococcota bacterium]